MLYVTSSCKTTLDRIGNLGFLRLTALQCRRKVPNVMTPLSTVYPPLSELQPSSIATVPSSANVIVEATPWGRFDTASSLMIESSVPRWTDQGRRCLSSGLVSEREHRSARRQSESAPGDRERRTSR